MRPTPRLAAPLAAALLAAPSAARANGFALDIQGAYANGTAGAAAGDPRGPAVQFVNPAALAALDGTRIAAGGMLVYPRAPYTDAGSTLAAGAPRENGDGATDGRVPWVFASQRVTPNVTLGFGVTTPFGLASDFGRDRAFVGRYQGIESKIESIELGPAAGWHVGGRMNVGAAVAARRDHVVQSIAIDLGSQCVLAAGDATCGALGLAPGTSDAYARFDGEGWSWATILGATLEPVEGTIVGVAWRHEVRSTIRGDESFALPPGGAEFLAAAAAGDPTVSSLAGSRAGMQLRLPDFVTLHASHRLGSVTLLGALQWTRWKDFDAVELVADSPATGLSVRSDQQYQNAIRLALGANWTVRRGLDVHGGVAYEQTPIQDAYREATLPEVDSILVGLGGEVAIAAGFSVAAGWQHVEPTGTSRIDRVGPAGDRLVGTARTRADLVLAQLAWRR
jgi:long-chain fatty acid transport protein